MATYLYGIVLARNAAIMPVSVTGLQGSAVRVLTCGEFGGVVSTMGTMPGSATLDDVRAHDAVLQAVVDSGATAVAVRFGQSFAGDEEACAQIVAHGNRTVSVLQQYDGCVEMRLLLAHDVEFEPPAIEQSAGPGTAYLAKLRSERDHIEKLALREALGPVVQDERVEALPRGRGVAFSHLVRREDVESYRVAVAAMPALAEAVSVGPLALYTFAEPAT